MESTGFICSSYIGLLFIGLDGKIAIWDLENMEEELGHQF